MGWDDRAVTALPVQRLVFRSRREGGGADEAQRLSLWWEEHVATPVGIDISPDAELVSGVALDYMLVGGLGLGRARGSINRWERRHEHIARDGEDRFTLNINRGVSQTWFDTRSNSAMLAGGAASLFDHSEPTDYVCPGGTTAIGLMMPRRMLHAALPNAEDLVGTTVQANNEALRLLGYFADGLLDDEELVDPTVLAHAAQSLLDLTALAFGTDRDNAEVARLRGLRAARLAAVLRCIRRDYADPDVTPEAVARRVGISPRYLHVLLHETGASFAERVQELRVTRAFALLTAAGNERKNISDTAYAAGFSDLSHFNRLFRRKYGLTPTAARRR